MSDFDPTSLSQDKLLTYRNAAEQAFGDDTRHEKFAGHPNLSHGHCYVVSKWLTKHWGGYVGIKNGHYFWVSPDKTHAVDLTGDAHPSGKNPGPVLFKRTSHKLFKDLRVKTNTPDTPRAKLFAKRADDILAGRKTADLMGPTAYPGSTPQAIEDMNKYLHDEPWVNENDSDTKQFQFFYGQGQLHVSPIHSTDQLRALSGTPEDHNGPIATGTISVTGGRAKWNVQSNMALRGLSRIFSDYGKSVGWKFDGFGNNVQSSFGPQRTMYFAWDKGLVLSERPLRRFAGTIEIEGTNATVRYNAANDLSSSGYEQEPFLGGLEDWAKDFGYKLAEYPGTETDFNDKIKKDETLETFDRWDPDWKPKEEENPEPDTNFECPSCHIPLDTFGEYMLHVQNHHPGVDPIEDGHFPVPGNLEDPLPARRHDSRPTAVPLASFREATNVEGFDLYSSLWGFDRDDGLVFYGGYDNGELLGYACVRPDGDQTEIVMINAVPGRGLGYAMGKKILEYHPGVYSNAG
jgi:hypothetical protein